MFQFVSCVLFNELELGDIFDYRIAVGTMYQVTLLTAEKVYYRPLNEPFSGLAKCEWRSGVGVVGLYEEKEVFNA